MDILTIAFAALAAFVGAAGGVIVTRPRRPAEDDEHGWGRYAPRYDRRYEGDPGDVAE